MTQSADALQSAHRTLPEGWDVFDSIPAGMAVFDRDLCIVRVNSRFANIISADASECIGMQIELVFPLSARVIESEARRVLDTGQPVTGLKTRCGGMGTGESGCQLLPVFTKGKISGVTLLMLPDPLVPDWEPATLFPAGWLKQGQKQAFWSTKSDGCVEYASTPLLEYLGLDLHRLQSARLEEWIHPEDVPLFLSTLEVLFKKARSLEIDVRIRRSSDGAYRWYLVRLAANSEWTAPVQGPMAVLAVATDIHERKAFEERLHLAHRAARTGAWEWDFGTGLMKCSDDFQQLMVDLVASQDSQLYDFRRYTVEDWLSLIHPDDREMVVNETERVCVSGGNVRQQFRVACGEDFRWFTTVATAIIRDGKPVRLIGLTTDTTEEHAAEEAALQDARLESIGRLAGGVAHDFNNLLAGILGGASFLQEILPEQHSARHILDVIMRSSERAAVLTKQLLAYSGRSTTTLRRIELSSAIREACSIAHGALPPNVDLVVHRGRDLLPVEADVNQIRDIVMNLALNAADAIGEHSGRIEVKTGVERLDLSSIAERFREACAQPGEYAFFEMRDTGEGMSSEILSRIYEPFFTTRFTGRGLGLSAVQGFVRGHRGLIEVSSAPGLGSTFRVFFPLLGREESSKSGNSLVPPTQIVLVIDDEEAVRHVAHAALGRAGYEVLTASDGATGVEVFQKRALDVSLVLLDVSMPGLSGVAVFQQLQEIRPEVPVLVTSGYQEGDAMAQFPEGPAGFLQKPFTVRQLSIAVENVVQKAKDKR